MPEVSMEWLRQQAKQLVKKHWDIKEIPDIMFVCRQDDFSMDRKLDWDKYGGYYFSDIQTVVMNNENNANYTLRGIKRILLHELVHWRLHVTGEPWRDSDERFARELIRVGLGRRHNKDEQAQLAAMQARKNKNNEFFEIYEVNGDTILVSRMSHHRKNQDDFKQDLANTLIKMHNEREYAYESILPADVADMMCKLYGYKRAPLAVYGVCLSPNLGQICSDIGDREDIADLLKMELDMDEDEIERKLKIYDAASDQ